MREFRDRVAVVTGAASGMGRAFAERFAAEGMKVVLADIEEAALAEAESAIRERGATTLAVRTDVAQPVDIAQLADAAYDAFGAVHILCNNAGVGAGGFVWECTDADWEWVLSVNLWGVINGCRTFIPRMLAGGEEGHIVNTASVAGLLAGPFMGPYNVSKFGVVALSETLHQELMLAQAKVRVSLLCPGLVNTNIADSARNRPAHLGDTRPPPAGIDGPGALRDLLKTEGLDPSVVAGQVFEAIREERFYVLTDDKFDERIKQRMENILGRTNPELRLVL